MKLTAREFDRAVEAAVARIPDEIRSALDNVVISVMKRPTPDMLDELDLAPNEPLLGFYQGTSLADRSVFEIPSLPDTIFIFQKPLEEMCESVEELIEEIEITVAHEIGHALGMSEERLAELGYD